MINSKRLYKSHFFERNSMFYIIGSIAFISIILIFIQIRDKGDEFQFSINGWKEFSYKIEMIIYLYIGIFFVSMFFFYSYTITYSYIEKEYLIPIWRNKKIDIHDIIFIEFEVVNGHGGDLTHFFIHTEKNIIKLECEFFYKKLYDALKELGIEINVRQEIVNRYPYYVNRAISKGMDIKVNPLLEKKYFKMKK